VFDSGVLQPIATRPCAQEHFWETFAMLPIPPDAGITTVPDKEMIAASPTVQRVCSLDVLTATLSGPAAQLPPSTWEIDVMPPTQSQFDSGDHTVRCVVTPDGKVSLGSGVFPDETGYTLTDF
jgi:hypothetical protein